MKLSESILPVLQCLRKDPESRRRQLHIRTYVSHIFFFRKKNFLFSSCTPKCFRFSYLFNISGNRSGAFHTRISLFVVGCGSFKRRMWIVRMGAEHTWLEEHTH